MFLLLLLIPLTAWVWSRYFMSDDKGQVSSWSKTGLLLSAWVVITTEALSAGYFIQPLWISLSWLLFLTVGIFLLPDRRSLLRLRLPSIHKSEKWFAGFIILVLLLTGVLACAAYPNNWDSMTYHLTRVMHWMQRHSVIHYATNNIRQVTQPPLAEYWILHILSMGGVDRLANLVQWTALVCSMLSVWGILQTWKADRYTRWTGMLLVATLPMAILQSTSTQNDLLAGALLLQSIYWFFRHRSGDRHATWWMLLAFSLALFAKGSNYIYLLPLLPVAGIAIFKTFGRSFWQPALFGVLILLLINGPHWLRNHDTFGRWTGSDQTLVNDSHAPAEMVAVALQNLTMECQTPFPSFNQAIADLILGIERSTGVAPNEPTINWAPSPPYAVGLTSLHEDYAGNLLFMLLCIAVIIWVVARRRKHPAFILAVLVSCMFIVFCVLLKWQIWHNRLHLPMLLAFAPVAAVGIRVLSRTWRTVVLVLFSMASVPWLVYNQSRPFVGDESVFRHYDYYQYFFNQPELLRTFLQMAAVTERNQVARLGWATSGDAWEYPMWKILKKDCPEMRHVLVGNETRYYERNGWQPDGILSNRPGLVALPRIQCHGRNFYRTYTDGQWAYYLPEPNL